MQYFILSLSSISNSFSIFESGDSIRFKYHHYYKGIGDISSISSGDFVLGYKRGVNLIKYVFKVIDVSPKDDELILEKVLESNNGISLDDAGLIDRFQQHEIIKIKQSEFINIYNNILTKLNVFDKEDISMNEMGLDSFEDDDESIEQNLELNRICCGKNTLIYGVPGVGKSWTVKNIKCKDIDEYYIERVVFHPDYTYSDFVGQILPIVSDNDVKYDFVPGPFTNIITKAYSNNTKEFFLIIEEINRGNAPAIFGDIFQLLDRLKKDENGFKKGTSEFGITNPDMAEKIYGDEKRKIRIPSNLSIIATMNTSDQNVFTLDTAFKRRWHMEMIENDFSKPDFKDKYIPNSNITWKVFGTAINEIILEDFSSTLSSEDKRLGAYFVDEEDLSNSKQFAEKVLMYLWDDVFKFNREDYFKKDSVDEFSLECFINKFENEQAQNYFKFFTSRVNNKFNEVRAREIKANLSDGNENDSK